MNKVILMGRLTRDPELRYSQSANPLAVAKYGLAVRRNFVKPGDVDVDFFNITAFGKQGEFAEKYFKKGQLVAVSGKLQINNWEDQQHVKHTSVDVIVDEQHFAESKSSFEARESTESQSPYNAYSSNPSSTNSIGGFTATATPTLEEDDDLPF